MHKIGMCRYGVLEKRLQVWSIYDEAQYLQYSGWTKYLKALEGSQLHFEECNSNRRSYRTGYSGPVGNMTDVISIAQIVPRTDWKKGCRNMKPPTARWLIVLERLHCIFGELKPVFSVFSAHVYVERKPIFSRNRGRLGTTTRVISFNVLAVTMIKKRKKQTCKKLGNMVTPNDESGYCTSGSYWGLSTGPPSRGRCSHSL